jgi:hypothetical protein
MSSSSSLPGFKSICAAVGITYVLLSVSTLLQGAPAIMAPFKVPSDLLSSPLFLDFFHWVFTHMAVLGVMIFLLGRFVETARHQQTVARVLLLVALQYTYLDVRTSVLGNGLYGDPRSLVHVAIDLLVVLGFAYLSLRPRPATGGAA